MRTAEADSDSDSSTDGSSSDSSSDGSVRSYGSRAASVSRSGSSDSSSSGSSSSESSSSSSDSDSDDKDTSAIVQNYSDSDSDELDLDDSFIASGAAARVGPLAELGASVGSPTADDKIASAFADEDDIGTEEEEDADTEEEPSDKETPAAGGDPLDFIFDGAATNGAAAGAAPAAVSSPFDSISGTSSVHAGVNPPRYGNRGVLLDRSSGGGGLRVEYAFSRTRSAYGDSLSAISLKLLNHREDDEAIQQLRIDETSLPADMNAHLFDAIDRLEPNDSVDTWLHVDFGGSNDPVKMDLLSDKGTYTLQIEPPVGEMMHAPKDVTHEQFATQLKGLYRHDEAAEWTGEAADLQLDSPVLPQRVVDAFHCTALPPIEEEDNRIWRFVAQMLQDDAWVLLEISCPTTIDDSDEPITLNCAVMCEDPMLNSRLAHLVHDVVVQG